MEFLSTPSARRATPICLWFWPWPIISIHALREEGDQGVLCCRGGQMEFLSTPSARRATLRCPAGWWSRPISIHALREEGDQRCAGRMRQSSKFLSTPSARRATLVSCRPTSMRLFLSTPSARRATIFVHRLPVVFQNFYPRPPRGGRPQAARPGSSGFLFLSTPSARRATVAGPGGPMRTTAFLSTPSARRATGPAPGRVHFSRYFYPRPPRGGRLQPCCLLRPSPAISIHALREEGDWRDDFLLSGIILFLSTPSARRATGLDVVRGLAELISIHALREEGDLPQSAAGRRSSGFLSTPSARRATSIRKKEGVMFSISIHALREEGDRDFGVSELDYIQFLSTPSARRATTRPATRSRSCCHFYPRPPRGGRRGARREVWRQYIFLSTPSARRATVPFQLQIFEVDISIHALREEGDRSSRQR